mgnify:CR=1 FL=1
MEWINNIQNPDIKDQIQNNNALIRKIHVLISMTATEIKNSNSSILKGISIKIAEELYASEIINESQLNRIRRKKGKVKVKKGNKKKAVSLWLTAFAVIILVIQLWFFLLMSLKLLLF